MSYIQHTEKNNRSKIGEIALFVIFPFFSSIYSLINIKDRTARKLLYCWFLVFGLSFTADNKDADSYKYKAGFEAATIQSEQTFSNQIDKYFSFKSNIKDIYTISANHYISRFTHNYHFLFLFYAAIFGFFYIKTLDYFLKYNVSKGIVFYLLLFMFCFSNPIFNINGVRFWTASWIGVYSCLKIFIDNKNKYFLLLALTPLIHGSFPIWIAMVVLAYFTHRLQKLWIVVFIMSSFVTALSIIDTLVDYKNYLPPYMQQLMYSYMESKFFEDRLKEAEALPTYAIILNSLPRYFALALGYIMILKRKLINATPLSSKLFGVFLVLASIANFMSAIPSLTRFLIVLLPILVILWSMNINQIGKLAKVTYFIPIVYAYQVLYWFRNVTSVTQAILYFYPAPLLIYNYLF